MAFVFKSAASERAWLAENKIRKARIAKEANQGLIDALKTLAETPKSAPVARTLPRDIIAAMKSGMTNSEIERMIKSGDLVRPSLAIALRTFAPDDVHEAQRRGLIR